jgi:hypothetical protein
MNDKAVAGADAAKHTIEAVRWDAALGGFVRLVVDQAGKVLSRADLDSSVKRATLRHLFETRLTRSQRASLYQLLRGLGFLSPVTQGSALTMPSLKCADKKLDAAEALAQKLEMSIRDFVLLGWVMVYVVNRPGVRVPPLEDIDPDLPWMPSIVPQEPPPYFCAESLLSEIEAEEPDNGFDARP